MLELKRMWKYPRKSFEQHVEQSLIFFQRLDINKAIVGAYYNPPHAIREKLEILVIVEAIKNNCIKTTSGCFGRKEKNFLWKSRLVYTSRNPVAQLHFFLCIPLSTVMYSNEPQMMEVLTTATASAGLSHYSLFPWNLQINLTPKCS